MDNNFKDETSKWSAAESIKYMPWFAWAMIIAGIASTITVVLLYG